MSKTPKVVLSCMCGSVDDPMYGNNGLLRSEYEKMVGGPIDFVSYAGIFLMSESEEYRKFMEDCKTADVLVMDAWNHPPDFGRETHGGGWSVERACRHMADIARTVSSSNPFARLFGQIMEGEKVAVHEFAIPFEDWRSPEIGEAIKRSLTIDGMKVLVLDDNPVHQEAAKSQFSGCKLAVASSYEMAEMWIKNCQFDAVLLDLMIPAPGRTMGKKGMAFAGQEMPIGIFLVLLALKQGARKIGLLTDTNHHDHPASACVDVFQSQSFPVGDVKIIVSNSYRHLNTESGQRVKNWKQLLEELF